MNNFFCCCSFCYWCRFCSRHLQLRLLAPAWKNCKFPIINTQQKECTEWWEIISVNKAAEIGQEIEGKYFAFFICLISSDGFVCLTGVQLTFFPEETFSKWFLYLNFWPNPLGVNATNCRLKVVFIVFDLIDFPRTWRANNQYPVNRNELP